MFAYRSQPLKSLYLLYTFINVLFIRLPYWTFISAIPALRPRQSWSMARTFKVRFTAASIDVLYAVGLLPPESNADKDSVAADATGFVWVDAIPESLIVGEVATMAKTNDVAPTRISGYWYGKRDNDGKHAQKASPGERVLYNCHGGGYVMSSGSPEATVSNIPRAVLDKCAHIVDRGFCPEYRLCSSAPFPSANPFPAPLIDALSGYHYLVTTLGFSPQNIIVSGDSAGGHLAASLVRYLATAQLPSLSPPGALLLFSPTMDWGCTHDDGSPSSSMEANADTDFVRTILHSGYSASSLRGAFPADDLLTNPWLSPGSLKIPQPDGLFSGFPRTCIVAGGAEQTVDAMRTFRERLVKDNGVERLKYLEYPDAFHDFVLYSWVEPERTDALNEIDGWLGDIYGV